ncbi:acyl carrier protein [Halalkalibacterium halodurans]|uniref:Acyl-carrier protein n=1 Tax=Halalkalibacterium halodurans (strain ATCC BAA-125 / DSM 18197 / FERM 7344 / JCM 9153 / C-125) TaxID=272558 RepID=Q9KBS8_HALH5|nr:acyl carrier protein [Halalkalibacterium halodurans]MDY7222406.1 acyl carrier protein [Halalkalibacterium halodurans]MDY7241627.1 acyl carrier protein [Halalkalibacterium halodurans]MED4082287.1 acyl carrier protein [Halalkalibacterium halodurans]MED4083562.1 acyl carrier protein [Halalkalibacterium halodurans]MED4105875.1 acyl carrier protein [Halalkalibacterium halodurans]
MAVVIKEAIFTIFAEVLELEENEITFDFSKEEHSEWDSVNSLRLFTNIEEELDVRLDMNAFMNAATIREVVALVEAQQA